jgi:hypothetical protein
MSRVRVATSLHRVLLLAPLAVLLLATAIAHAAKPDRTSAWRDDRDIRIDGFDGDWHGLTTPAKGARIATGFVNDDEWLYVCVQAKDRTARDQIVGQGLVVWIDRDGGKKRTFGIRFPLGRSGGFAGQPPRDRIPEAPPDPGRGGPPPDRLVSQDEFGVLGPGKDDEVRLSTRHAGGIEARVAIHEGTLVYELKVPLKQSGDHPYAIGVEPGAVLRVEMVTPEYRGPMRQGRGPSGGAGGTIGGGGGGWGGGIRGAYPVGADPRVLNPLKLTTSVQLASGPPR